MAKFVNAFQCEQCGAFQPKWVGQCPDCKSWNSLIEVAVGKSAREGPSRKSFRAESRVRSLAEVGESGNNRLPSGMSEMDRVLGGGIVPGSVLLLGGDPGIGKSTLLLQLVASLHERVDCLYVTGEESLEQIGMRGRRLGLSLASMRCMATTGIEAILEAAERERPGLLVVDSVQTVSAEDLQSAPGSVSQVRECAGRLVHWAKDRGCCVVLVGHVTKEGSIAGPRVLEHMVDVVLYFESEAGSRFRIVRAVKNRFGAVNELGMFAMTDKGLREVSNPSAIFLSGHEGAVPGSIVTVVREGSRPILLEVQALVDTSYLANPRRVCLGLEQNRLAMMLAVLHRHGQVALMGHDVFINVVGGMRISGTEADLPMILALVSSFRNRALPEKLVCFGEVGLSGEIRPVPEGEERLREAASHGYRQALIPAANLPRKQFGSLQSHGVRSVRQALDWLDTD